MLNSMMQRWRRSRPQLLRVTVITALLLASVVPTAFAQIGAPPSVTPRVSITAGFPTRFVTPVVTEPTGEPSETASPVVTEPTAEPSETVTPVETQPTDAPSQTATPVVTEPTDEPSETATPVGTQPTVAPSETATPVGTQPTDAPSPTVSPTPTAESCESGKSKLLLEVMADKAADVQKLIDAGKYQEAIDLAIKEYGIDVSAVSGKPTYDKDFAHNGGTCKDGKAGKIRIGKPAFKSPGWLASTIGHESCHAQQAKDDRWYTDAQGSAINEVECYDWEIANAGKNGLTRAEIDDLKKTRKEYYDMLTDANKKRVDAGNYTLP